ncbi:hypothetical protein, partial [Halomonas sp.]|uniref:hypothetical protein n=1 Tax=Halomonas sp. TaxID=1486246 RepID=UPI00257CDDB4
MIKLSFKAKESRLGGGVSVFGEYRQALGELKLFAWGQWRRGIGAVSIIHQHHSSLSGQSFGEIDVSGAGDVFAQPHVHHVDLDLIDLPHRPVRVP